MKGHKFERIDAIDLRMIINFVLNGSHNAHPILLHNDTTLAILLKSPFDFIDSHTEPYTLNTAQPR